MAYDTQPIDGRVFEAGEDAGCHALATRAFQGLVKQLFNLPSSAAPVGRIASLPPPTTVLPREKPIPKPRPPTKWELFAQRKGITKRKRSKLEWDESKGEWKRRYGYKKANDEADVPIIEARPDEVAGTEDPFTRIKKEKKERVKKQEASRLKNLKSAAKTGGKDAIPSSLRLAASLPEHGQGKPLKRKELKGEIKTAIRQVSTSTASLGKYDRLIKGEDVKDRKLGTGKKRKFLPVAAIQQEREAQGKLVDHILRKNADDIVDIGRAIGKLEAEAREDRRQVRMKNKGDNKKGRLTGKPPKGQSKTANEKKKFAKRKK